jgi:predicted TIM-barrel fold metal-dependent hydrolase
MATDGVDKASLALCLRRLGVHRLQNDYACRLPRSAVALSGACVLIPSTGALAEAERCLAEGACGFGELFPAGHGFSLEGEGMSRLAALAQEAGVPLLIHVNEQIGHMYPGKGDVGAEEAYRFAVKNPGVTTIFAILAGGCRLRFHCLKSWRWRTPTTTPRPSPTCSSPRCTGASPHWD